MIRVTALRSSSGPLEIVDVDAALHRLDRVPQRGMGVEARVLGHDGRRRGPGCLDDVGVAGDREQTEGATSTGLLVAEHVALLAELEVEVGDPEPVERAGDRLEPRPTGGV